MSLPSSEFPSTRWTVVKAVQGADQSSAREALANLCKYYWYPIYAYLRRSGHPPQDAEDRTQDFFCRVLQRKVFQSVDQRKGRLRSYLLGVLKRSLSDDQRKHRARKRGGGEPLVSLDAADPEERYQLEPSDLQSPDLLFDQTWARSILVHASDALREQFAHGNNEEAFTHLSEFLPLGENARSYREVAGRMGVDERVVRLQVHRMRKRYRKIVEDEISRTVETSGEVAEELDYLMAVLSQ